MTPPSASALLRRLGLSPDPWQTDVLDAGHPRLLLNCCRQAGKSTAVAMLGLVEALYHPGCLVLLVSRSHRQSAELLAVLAGFHRRLGSPFALRHSRYELRLANRSRILSLPCTGDTVRGYAAVRLLVIDEAARVPDDLYRTCAPPSAPSTAGWSACPRPTAAAASSTKPGRRPTPAGTASRSPPPRCPA